MLGGCKLSLLNQVAAPLLAGSARLFVAADLSSSSSSSSEPRRPQLLPLLSAARHIQAVCTKGPPATAAGISSTAGPAADARWQPCQEFVAQLERRRHAEQQRRAEAAALAAAEADRRERLRQAVKQRQQGQQQELQRAAGQHMEQQQQQPQEDEQQQAAGGYQPAAYGSPSKGGQPAPASQPQPAAGSGLPGGDAGLDESISRSSLQQLRQQFQTLYLQTVGDGGAASPPQRPAGGSNNGSPRWAAGVAAADDVAMHVAALRMQAAAQAQRELLGLAADGSGDGSGGAAFSWSPHSDGCHSRPTSGGEGSGSLGRQLEEELMLLQRDAAAARAAGGAAGSPLASLADLGEEEGEALSLGALYRKQPVSRTGAGSMSQQQQRHERDQQEQQEQWQAPVSAAEATPQSGLGAAGRRWPAEPAAAAAPASVEVSEELSDVFKSENMPLWSPAGAAAAGASTASCSRPLSAASSQQQLGGGGGGGSYAGMQRRRPPPLASAGLPGLSTAGGSPFDSQQLELPSPSTSALVPAAAAGPPPAPHLWQHSAESAAAVLDSADVEGLLEDLQREQRLNAALLQQLHEVQQQLEETAAAATAVAAAQPPAPGVEDPADFNGLLAGVCEAVCAAA